MNPLQRAIIEKTGNDNGFEHRWVGWRFRRDCCRLTNVRYMRIQ